MNNRVNNKCILTGGVEKIFSVGGRDAKFLILPMYRLGKKVFED